MTLSFVVVSNLILLAMPHVACSTFAAASPDVDRDHCGDADVLARTSRSCPASRALATYKNLNVLDESPHLQFKCCNCPYWKNSATIILVG